MRFLNISKAFEFDINAYCISIWYILMNRFQRLNGQTSKGKKILAGVRQGATFAPLFFLFIINNIREGIQPNIKIKTK